MDGRSLRHRGGAALWIGAALAWTAAGAGVGATESVPVAIDVAIGGVAIVDVERGRLTGPRTVLVAGGRIVAISETTAESPAAATRIDGRGRYLIPGLVDMHVHLFNNASHRPPNDWTFPLFVGNGVTAVREMAANGEQLAQVARWNDAVLAGELVAPRVLAAGIPVNGRSPGAVAHRVEQAATAGADFIKVFSDVAAPGWRAIVAAARAHALPVAGHAPASVALLVAARDGLRSNEHLSQVYEACSSVEGELLASRQGLDATQLAFARDAQEQRALDAHDPGTCSRVAAALAGTAQAQVPTLVLPYFEAHPGSTALPADARWSSLRADEQARWLRILAAPPSEQLTALARRRWQVSRAIVTTLHRAGVPLLAGTDAPMPRIYPGHSLHDELALLVEGGLTPAEALRAATLAPAHFLGLAADAGSVATGKRADLVVLDADPLRDIRNTRRIHAVVLAGRALRPDDLDPASVTR